MSRLALARSLQEYHPAVTETVTLVGRVIRKRVSPGSKSARDAVVLVSPDQSLTLRRLGFSSYGDSDLGKLVGKHVRATGVVTAGQLIMHTFEVIDKD